MKFSANLGFLWNQLPLTTAIHAAKEAGFDAVECHWPYDVPSKNVAKALKETNLKMIGLNTRRGNVRAGENGLAALIGREEEARLAIDEAITYAAEINALNIHVMAGLASGKKAQDTFIANLHYACEMGRQHNTNILIEPLNTKDAPGYFLNSTNHAMDIIKTVNCKNLKLMFDCYHIQLMQGNLNDLLKDLVSYIGHIQFASVPNRGPPGIGDLDFQDLFLTIKKLGWTQPLGAEYKPTGDTEETLNWLREAKSL
tara:strand:- start:4275 stop:5042 length:768 start_codon:yes stop_codon:yes gene_type:complete